jgi:acyl carrier protein
MLNVSERHERLDCVFEYDCDAFSRERIECLSSDFVRLIAAASSPNIRLDEIQLKADCLRSRDMNKREFSSQDSKSFPVISVGGDAIEARLEQIWMDLLLVDEVPADADFLMLGGHSLLLANLAWRISTEFDVRIRISSLDRHRTLQGMASLIRDAPSKSAPTDSLPSSALQIVSGIPCQIEFGVWTRESLEQLFKGAAKLRAGDRLSYFARALIGTPFQFESLRPLPLTGRLPVRLGALDCITFVYTALAMAMSKCFEDLPLSLRTLRYHDDKTDRIDSHPETGNIFDFADESLLINAVRCNVLDDVTAIVAGMSETTTLRKQLMPAQRAYAVDRSELWATPKLENRKVSATFVAKPGFGCVELPTNLSDGDIILMSRGNALAPYLIDHVGIAIIEDNKVYLLQSTRHFTWRQDATASMQGTYTGVFYDDEHTQEQIGVGFMGHFCGDHLAFERDGITYYGYSPNERRCLKDYLDSNFSYINILRMRDIGAS